MSRGFKVPINLVGLTTDPSTASAGDIYFNVTSSKIRYYTSTGWQDVGSGTGGGGTLNHTHDYNGNPIAGVGSLVGTTSFGAGVPNNDNGFENDLYIDITNLDIYKKGPSIWAAPTEINVYTKGEISSLLANKQDKISGVSDTEIGYLDGVTSAIQTQLDSKLSTANLAEAAQDAVAGAIVAGTGITQTYDDAGNTITIAVDTTSIQARVANVSDTEIGYLDGVTSGIQTQLNTKSPLASPTFTGTPSAPTAAVNTNTTQIATTAFVGTAVGSVSQALTNFQSSSTNTFVAVALLGVADGVATLDSTGNVPYSQLGNIGSSFASTSALSDVEALALAGL
jgi:hypothetical protein